MSSFQTRTSVSTSKGPALTPGGWPVTWVMENLNRRKGCTWSERQLSPDRRDVSSFLCGFTLSLHSYNLAEKLHLRVLFLKKLF